jgi:uridylate kinase
MSACAYKRVLLKVSGEAFGKPGQFGLDPEEVRTIARQAQEVRDRGCELAVVVGGGNFLRGVAFARQADVRRATADYMGMVATVLNALALQDALEAMGADTRVQSAIEMRQVCEPYIRRRAIRHLEKGRIVILAGGTGNPFFTTDTCAALRASELGAEVLLKATKVDGVYSADPHQDPAAQRFDRISYEEVTRRDLRILDLAAIDLCRQNRIPIVVFNLKAEGNLARVVSGEPVGTLVGGA